jgi:hypothetical protein
MTNSKKRWLVLSLMLASTILLPVCGSDSPTASSNNVVVTGCNTVTYQGNTWSNLGCAPGVASFTATITTGGRTACFQVTCSSGCISTARAC